jgi:hypothetical protein
MQPRGAWARSISCPQDLKAAREVFAKAPMARPEFGIYYGEEMALYCVNDLSGERIKLAERIG